MFYEKILAIMVSSLMLSTNITASANNAECDTDTN